MSWARVAGIGSAVLVGAAVAAGVRLWSVDPEQAFAEAALEIRQATGLDVAVAGSFALDLSWPPHAVVDNVTIANPVWATRPSMAVVQRLEAELDVLPLLVGEVRPTRVVLSGVDLLLERDRDGLRNWAAAPVENRRAIPAEWTSVTSSLTDVVINRGRLSFIDHASKEERTISLDRLTVHAPDDEQPIEIEADARINAAAVALAGTLGSVRQIKSGLPFDVDIKAAGAGAAIAVAGRVARQTESGTEATGLAITIGGADLRELGPMVDVPLPPVGPYSLSAILGTDRTGYRLSALKLNLGRSDLSGEVFVEAKEGRSRLVATLTSTLVDLAEFGPPPAVDAEMPTSDMDTAPADLPSALAIPVVLEAQIYFSGAKVIGDRFDLERVTADMTLSNDRPAMDAIDDGAEMPGLGDGASGDVRLAAEAGSIDADLARRLLSDQAAILAADGAGIEFNCMAGRVVLAAGEPMTAMAVIDAPAATIEGVGQLDLRAQTMDMRLTPLPKREELVGRMAPVVARGPLAEPEVIVDSRRSARRTDPVSEEVGALCMTRLDTVAETADVEVPGEPAEAGSEIAAEAPTETAPKRSRTRLFQGFLESFTRDLDTVLGPSGKLRPTPIKKMESKKLR